MHGFIRRQRPLTSGGRRYVTYSAYSGTVSWIYKTHTSCGHLSVIRQLFNIMHHAVELPLTLYFLFASEAEAVQLFVGADIAEHRFHD